MSKIKFGTDGWRAIMGEDFIPENVAKVIQAFCDWKKTEANRLIYVGYDRRNNSTETAQLVATVLANNGFSVRLSEDFCPTPAISWLVKSEKALAGVVITASHNPPQWNGIKFKNSVGGAAGPEYTDEVESRIPQVSAVKVDGFDTLLEQETIQYFNSSETYGAHLKEFIAVDKIKAAGFKVAVDPLFGAGTDVIKGILDNEIVQIHDAADPNFGGLNPEPIEKNLSGLMEAVVKEKADIGLATDGDADRIGAVDSNGKFINSHQIFGLLLQHNVAYRGGKGAIIHSVSTTQIIDKICAHYGLESIETPIGFKYISGELIKRNALMGGEESGGISLRDHVHERDGVLNGLLLLEMMAVKGMSLVELINDMDEEFGKYFFERKDYKLTAEHMIDVKEKIAKEDLKELAGVPVARYNTIDGHKIILEDDSWIMVRASGTEPLLRVYSEASTQERVGELHGFMQKYLAL
jgi:alpha-D-glucose phosphate-specific phosphoglucomutase